MKIIIAGGREITNVSVLQAALDSCPFLDDITEVVTGAARGIDTLADQWAEVNGIDRTIFPANWNKYNKAAGQIRNKRMLDYILLSYPSCGLIAVPGNGPGTRGMIDLVQKAGIGNIHIYEP